MARKNYKLTDETFKVLSKKEQAIADEYDCDGSYIYAIKNGESPDPYPHFRRLFRAAARAGAKAEIWFNDLAGILINSRPIIHCTEFSKQLLKKIRTDAECTEKMIEAVADGELDKSECHELLAINQKVLENARHLEMILQKRLGEIETNQK